VSNSVGWRVYFLFCCGFFGLLIPVISVVGLSRRGDDCVIDSKRVIL
jgi:hypothetical protein